MIPATHTYKAKDWVTELEPERNANGKPVNHTKSMLKPELVAAVLQDHSVGLKKRKAEEDEVEAWSRYEVTEAQAKVHSWPGGDLRSTMYVMSSMSRNKFLWSQTQPKRVGSAMETA